MNRVCVDRSLQVQVGNGRVWLAVAQCRQEQQKPARQFETGSLKDLCSLCFLLSESDIVDGPDLSDGSPAFDNDNCDGI